MSFTFVYFCLELNFVFLVALLHLLEPILFTVILVALTALPTTKKPAQLSVFASFWGWHLDFFFPFTDTSLKDGLFHEFKKHGKVTSVQIHGASEDRYGLVFFRQQEDQEKALTVSKGKLFFGMLIEVTAWNGPGKSWQINSIMYNSIVKNTWFDYLKNNNREYELDIVVCQ